MGLSLMFVLGLFPGPEALPKLDLNLLAIQ